MECGRVVDPTPGAVTLSYGYRPMELWVAIGTMLLAVATFVLAAITGWNVKKTGNLVKATKESDAAKQTIAEVQRDRELEYRPYLSWKVSEVVMNGSQIVDPGKVSVANFGRGPALHAICCLAWRMSAAGDQGPAGPVGAQGAGGGSLDMATTVLFDLSPGEQGKPEELPLERRDGQMADDDVLGNPVTPSPVRVAFCHDQLGTDYRFVRYQPADTWRDGAVDRPRWAEFYLSHFKALSRQ